MLQRENEGDREIKVEIWVTWTSQALGCEKTKTGVIIAEIPANHKAKRHISSVAKKGHIKLDADCSIRDRALVVVPARKDGQIAQGNE